MERELILTLKEKKYNLINSYLSEYQVVTLTPNIPGEIKNIPESFLLLNIFDKEILKLNPLKTIKYNDEYPYNLYLFKRNQISKDCLVEIEENHELGRLIDIDLYNSIKSESRGVLRKCFICDKPAFICRKENNHSLEELLNYIEIKIKNYIGENIASIAYYSTIEELKLNPKFGLVSYDTNGSHKDMDYKLMEESIKAIKPFFKEAYVKCFKVSDLKEVRRIAKEIGVKAEDEMFKATNGINTYKGLIFHLLNIIAAISYKDSNKCENVFICDIIKLMCSDILNEFNTHENTVGIDAYKRYNITGARGLALSGYEIVFNSLDKLDLGNKESMLKYLAYLIENIDDTVLLKRCSSLEKYNEVRNMFKDFKVSNAESLTEYMIKNNYSFGGSADILIVSIFIKMLLKENYIKEF